MNQLKYFSDAEEQLLGAIADNDQLFHAIRNVMWEFPLTDPQKTALANNYTNNKAMQEAVEKLFLPQISPDTALTQTFDLFMTLNVEGKEPDAVKREVLARNKLIELVSAHLDELAGETPTLSWTTVFNPEEADEDALYIGLIARNTYLQHIDNTLNRNVKILAQKRKEDSTEKKKKDSAK